ncbi:pyrroline-5-carboxylate reductase [Eurytemora carolleeae]|uniref:pyrroline-5-carboxylate reductase n=1 Tax=Eurytemora carolleeae TaxID=1294199 RepID=UPI000C7631D0|nr:pyrroline-5-carboxylate reductase [Eurytemora carolleeae]|eukprot:XP_023335193.1 pyrroline-5-carboxylate reductase-like [Eurytemora affinis]
MGGLSKVGVIGAGKMAGALLKGWIGSGVIKSNQVLASVPKQDEALLEPFKQMGCNTTFDNKDVGEWSDTILLGVKPGIVEIVAQDLIGNSKGDQLLVSIAAGLNTQTLQQWFGPKFRVIRVMPNTAVEVGCGASVYATGSGATSEDCKNVETLFYKVGKCWRVKEQDIDAITGISGSGPAYMYLILEALTEEGVRQGLGPDLARNLAAQTMQGAGMMASIRHPSILRGEVTSPGGSTAEGVRALEKGGIRYIIMEAVAATARRCRQIGSL